VSAVYLQQIPSYSNHNCKKSSFLRTQTFIFLFALGTPLWQSRKTLHEWKDNLVLTKPLAACTHLSWTVSQLFEPQLQKIAVFTYRSPHFCFPWRRPCDYHEICCMDEKTIQCLSNLLQHVPIYLQQFPSYSNRNCKKNRRFHVLQPTFLFRLETPLRLSPICSMDGKTIQCLPNTLQHVLSIFNSFRIIRCLSQCVSPKIAIFTTFWFPLGTPLGQSR